MGDNCDHTGGPRPTALLHLAGEDGVEDSSTASLYALREQQQLGNIFTMVGNLHNVASGYSTDCSSSPQKRTSPGC